MFQFQALVWPNSNDCLSALYITLLIPCLCTQAYTLGYCEWAFVRLMNRPLCLVSRLKVYREKTSFYFASTRMKFTVSLCNEDPSVSYYYISLTLHMHFYSEWSMAWKKKDWRGRLRLLFPCCCQYYTVRSSRKLDYLPAECIMISFQFKSGSVVQQRMSCCHRP